MIRAIGPMTIPATVCGVLPEIPVIWKERTNTSLIRSSMVRHRRLNSLLIRSLKAYYQHLRANKISYGKFILSELEILICLDQSRYVKPILGKAARRKEDPCFLYTRGKPGLEHLNEPLHVITEAELPANVVDAQLKKAQEIIEELLIPVSKLYKRQQLRELALLKSLFPEDGSKQPSSNASSSRSGAMKRASRKGIM